MSKILDFMLDVIRLKDEERAGWIMAKVRGPESVSDHSFSTALMSMVFANRLGLDADKCLKMALIHDLGEAYTGDMITRFNEKDQPVGNEEKKRLGDEATRKIISILPERDRADMLDLWEEFERMETEESQLVSQIDSLDYAIQLLKYRDRTDADLSEFLRTADERIKLPELREVFEEVKARLGKR